MTYQHTGEGYVVKNGETKVPIIGEHPETVEYQAWLDAGNSPEYTPAAVEIFRQAAYTRIQQARAAAQEQGFEHDGKTWSLSERAAGRMSRMATRVIGFSELPRGKQTQTVRDLSGVPHDLDQQDIRALVRAGHDRMDELDDTEDALLEQIAVAQTVEELEAIQWPTD